MYNQCHVAILFGQLLAIAISYVQVNETAYSVTLNIAVNLLNS